jgi:hypothetical protein
VLEHREQTGLRVSQVGNLIQHHGHRLRMIRCRPLAREMREEVKEHRDGGERLAQERPGVSLAYCLGKRR